ncbi:MAG: amidase, partial [Gammaproteobacteria bacterium]|nr:amidase [Gammaproteobacteria bacterium]
MGRNVEDTIRLLGTIAGFDRRAPLTMRDELPGHDAYRPVELKNLRIGWLGDYNGYLAMEPGILELCERALGVLEDGGAVVEATMPAFDLDRRWQTLLTLRHWSIARRQPMLEDPAIRELLKPEIVWEIEGSIGLTAADVSAAAVARAEWYRSLHNLFERFDFLALPSAQVFPFPADVHWPKSIAGRTMDTYHRWMEVVIGGTLAGVPVVNVPVGFDDRGRPMGMQLIGPFGEDRAVLELAMAYEASTDFLAQRPDLRDSL